MRQRRGTPGGALRGDDVAIDIGEPPLAQPRADHLHRAGDARQQIVEVVREATGQLADRLHLLRLPQLLLGAHQLGGALRHALLQRLVERAQRGGGAVALGFSPRVVPPR